MTYPQLIASQEVIEGQSFWRLFTELQSSGDIYEVDVSALAFVIGPQSDIARVRVTYYDLTTPSKSSSFVVSLGDPFSGRIDALASVRYPNNVPARTLISPEDIINRTLTPTGFNILEDNLLSIKTRIDVLAYLTPPSFVPAMRADFTTRGVLPVPASVGIGDASSWLSIPYYKRRGAMLRFRNTDAAAYTINVVGVSYMANAAFAFEEPIATGVALAGNSSALIQVRSNPDGLYDKLIIEVKGPANDGLDLGNCLYYDLLTTDEVI
jgi:hypothetical protein